MVDVICIYPQHLEFSPMGSYPFANQIFKAPEDCCSLTDQLRLELDPSCL